MTMNILVKETIAQEDRVLDPGARAVILILLLTIVKNVKTVKTAKMVEMD
jgi:phosphoribosylformylglycinamidine (FGAM) synthase PurS component